MGPMTDQRHSLDSQEGRATCKSDNPEITSQFVPSGKERKAGFYAKKGQVHGQAQ